MELNLTMFLIVCPLAFLAGFIDAIAGGGGLISVQAYMLTGLPIHFCLGTSKLSSTMGTMIASWRYYKNKLVDMWLCIPSIAVALGGSALGTRLTIMLDGAYLQKLLLVIVPVTAFFVFRNKNLDDVRPALSRKKTILYSVIISFVIGAYDGFIGPGTGTFLVLLYIGIAKMDSRIASGNTKIVNLSSNVAALAVFLINRRVVLPLGLCAGLFGVAGGYLGAGMVIKKGGKAIRVGILTVLGLLFLKTAWDIFFATSGVRP
jgi:uncharacterized membrane protein YfcA